MPDSLSKTVPIWCCVLNRVLFPDQPEHHSLYVPPNVVSDSERSQMLARVPSFVASFRELNLDLASLRGQVTKPLRPTVSTSLWYSSCNVAVEAVAELRRGNVAL